MPMANAGDLQVISEKTLQHAVESELLTYCPSMDLVALGATDRQVLIYRLNGQKVYGAAQKGKSLTVDRIGWKPNGKLLAIASSDGDIRLVGAESNKIVHQIATVSPDASQGPSGFTCLSWVSNLTRKEAQLSQLRSKLSWKDLIDEGLNNGSDTPALDLPRDLALIDIESSMPKLSVLPAGGTAEDIFSARASVEGLFRNLDPRDNDSVDILIVGTADGCIHLSIYDSFVVGTFPSPLTLSQKSNYQLFLHASHSAYSTHALLMKSTSSLVGALYFVPMDLRFVSASSGYLPLLASRSTALENLLRYIQQVQALMLTEWQATQDLPGRFLQNINETLSEKGGGDIVQAMYHSVATGHSFPAVKEWLVNELAERGHKRWDKTVSTGLENIRRLVHENMLPALERCNVILSRLSGISKYQSSSDTMGFSSHQIALLMDTVTCLNLVSSKILVYVVDDIELFSSFSIWLRFEIDRLASESSSQSDDNMEKEATIDHSKVLQYIQTSMMSSRLSAFFQTVSEDDAKTDWKDAAQGLPLFEEIAEQLRRHELRTSYKKALPNLDLLCKHFEQQANKVFKQIAEAEKKNVLFRQPVPIQSNPNVGPIAMQMFAQNETTCNVYIAMASKAGGQSTLHVTRIDMTIEKSISSTSSTHDATLAPTPTFSSGTIRDLAFLDDDILIVLWYSAESVASLLLVSFRASPPQDALAFNFPPDPGFEPDRLEVRPARGASKPGRICVLSKDRLRYRIFALPALGQGMEHDGDVTMSQE